MDFNKIRDFPIIIKSLEKYSITNTQASLNENLTLLFSILINENILKSCRILLIVYKSTACFKDGNEKKPSCIFNVVNKDRYAIFCT